MVNRASAFVAAPLLALLSSSACGDDPSGPASPAVDAMIPALDGGGDAGAGGDARLTSPDSTHYVDESGHCRSREEVDRAPSAPVRPFDQICGRYHPPGSYVRQCAGVVLWWITWDGWVFEERSGRVVGEIKAGDQPYHSGGVPRCCGTTCYPAWNLTFAVGTVPSCLAEAPRLSVDEWCRGRPDGGTPDAATPDARAPDAALR